MGGVIHSAPAPMGGSIAGGMSRGNSSYEHRLAEVEKKLQSLMDEMKALRKERRREKPESDQKFP